MELAYNYMARDQYGQTVMIHKHPRKELCERVGIRHADKMYIDTPEGAKHVGYVIGGQWFTVWGLEGKKFTD
jgi:acyl-CoA synthetase (NDP forming)